MKSLTQHITEKLVLKSNSKIRKSIYNDFEYVDLALPSGTLWAKCNIGAKNETDAGDYFAWGETETKDTYNWNTYKFGNTDNILKYNESDKLTVLENEDDAAYKILGSECSIPTIMQFLELKEKTKKEFVFNYKESGVNGFLLTSKYNDNTLFFPVCGYKLGKKLYEENNEGFYHTTALHQDDILKCYNFSLRKHTPFILEHAIRTYGASIRAVKTL